MAGPVVTVIAEAAIEAAKYIAVGYAQSVMTDATIEWLSSQIPSHDRDKTRRFVTLLVKAIRAKRSGRPADWEATLAAFEAAMPDMVRWKDEWTAGMPQAFKINALAIKRMLERRLGIQETPTEYEAEIKELYTWLNRIRDAVKLGSKALQTGDLTPNERAEYIEGALQGRLESAEHQLKRLESLKALLDEIQKDPDLTSEIVNMSDDLARAYLHSASIVASASGSQALADHVVSIVKSMLRRYRDAIMAVEPTIRLEMQLLNGRTAEEALMEVRNERPPAASVAAALDPTGMFIIMLNKQQAKGGKGLKQIASASEVHAKQIEEQESDG